MIGFRKVKSLLTLLLILLLTTLIMTACDKNGISKKGGFSEKNGTYAAIDDLGRSLVMPDDKNAKTYNKDKMVGIFYFLWHGDGDTSKVYDITKILASDPEAPYKWNLWGGVGIMHWWGEPLFGYYYASDDWVMRKHVQMLTDADVDFLVFDTTNNSTYSANALKLFKILDEYQKQGWDVPKVAFYTNTESAKRMMQIYEDIYKKYPEYKDIWFNLEGKPLIIGRYESSSLSDEFKDFFTIKHSQWPNESYGDGIFFHEDGFPWMEFERPQHVYGKSLKTTIMNVSIAQHQSTVKFSDTAMYGDDTNWTRSYHNGKNDKSEGAYLHGYNFQEQWDYAISQDPDLIFVTGWNEWIAGNWGNKNDEKPLVFVDACEINTSRDSEPMRGGYGDNYYLQLINNIRRFKGVKSNVNASNSTTIDINGTFDQWNDVKAVYTDYENDTVNRNSKGYGKVTYVNETGRNDFVTFKVTHDKNNIYFYAETKENITHPSDVHWMNLFISTGNSKNDNWYGYDFVVNRKNPDWDTYLEKCTGGFSWEEAAVCSFRYEGNKVQIAVPREALGFSSKDKINIQFKWADNYQGEGDFWSFYTDGDTAPYGRLNYLYAE